jgi:pimeloyl-ACP methyl ester carboxylesterase
MVVRRSPARHDGLPELAGVRHRWLDVQSQAGPVRLHLAEAGAGPPVLLLHGWPQHWWCWHKVIERLRDRYRRPGFVPWFVRLGGQAGVIPDADAALYAGQFRDPARAAATARLYRSYLGLARAVLVRRPYESRRLQAPARLLFGAGDFYIPTALLEGIEAHGDDLTLEVVTGGHWLPEEHPDLVAERARALFG